MNIRARKFYRRCLLPLWFLLFAIALLPGVVLANGRVESGYDIPDTYDVDITSEVLQDCASGRIHCYPILADDRIISQRTYDSWSLFLICNPALLHKASASSLASLFNQFTAFGNALGKHNAAVWFIKKASVKNPDNPKNLDVDRSVEYCSKFKLDRGNGPHVVVTSMYPSLTEDIRYDLVLSLGGMNGESIEQLLTDLATQVGNAQLDQSKLNHEMWLQKLKQTVTSVVDRISDAVSRSKITIKTHGLEATIEPTNQRK